MNDLKGKTFFDISGFQPLHDEMIQKYGLTAAAVYGRIWRRCQGREHMCWESIPKMAEALGCSVNTIRRGINKLVDAGEVSKIERKGDSALLAYTPPKEVGVPINIDEPLPNKQGTPPKEVDEDSNKIELKIKPKDFKNNNNVVVLKKLTNLTISKRKANKLLKTYSQDDIRRHLAYTAYALRGRSPPENKAGYFIRSLEEDWEPPRGFKKIPKGSLVGEDELL